MQQCNVFVCINGNKQLQKPLLLVIRREILNVCVFIQFIHVHVETIHDDVKRYMYINQGVPSYCYLLCKVKFSVFPESL